MVVKTKPVTNFNELTRLSPLEGYLSRGYIDECFGRNIKAEINYLRPYEFNHSKWVFKN